MIPRLSPLEGGVHRGEKVKRISLKSPISNASGSGDETGQEELRFPYANILGNRDLETTPQASF